MKIQHPSVMPMLAVAICGAALMVLPAAAQELIRNGDFSAGGPVAGFSTTIPFWTTFNQPGSLGAFYLSNSPADPSGANVNVGPKSFPNFAVSSELGAGANALLQSFTVPSGAVSVILSFDMFVNDYNGGPFCNSALDVNIVPSECVRVDLLTVGAGPLSTAPTEVIRNFYMGADSPLSANPHPYTHYTFDITKNVVPGGTYQLRFAQVDNQFFLNQGVDNVSIVAISANPNPCPAGLCIMNYRLVSQQAAAGGRIYATYRADLVSSIAPPIPILPPGTSHVVATLTNLDPFKVRAVPGQDQLMFDAVLNANSVTPSSNTFTVIIDPNVPFDPNQLQWTFQIGPAAPVANPGPNQIVPVGSPVTVSGLGSSNPSGIGGSLTYFWMFTSRPPGSMTKLFYENSPTAVFVADVRGTYVLQLTVSNGSSISTATVTIIAQ